MKYLPFDFDDTLTSIIIKCKECGKCCTDGRFKNLVLMKKDVDRIEKVAGKFKPDELNIIHQNGHKFFALKLPCKFLINGKCSIYEHRALACRQYPLYYFNNTLSIDDEKCPAGKEYYELKKKEFDSIIEGVVENDGH